MPMFLRRTHRIERSVNVQEVTNDEEFEILESGVLGSEERATMWDQALVTEFGTTELDEEHNRGTIREHRP